MWRDPSLLLDMLQAAQNAERFMTGVSRQDFDTDTKTQYAVLRALGIVGEAAGSVSEETRTQHPEIDWPNLVSLRNRLIHEYFRVDLDIVWEIVATEFVPLIQQLKAIVPAEGAE